jgi:hypothetical protein
MNILDGPAKSSCFNSEARPWTGSLDREKSDVPSIVVVCSQLRDVSLDFGRVRVENTEIGLTPLRYSSDATVNVYGCSCHSATVERYEW